MGMAVFHQPVGENQATGPVVGMVQDLLKEAFHRGSKPAFDPRGFCLYSLNLCHERFINSIPTPNHRVEAFLRLLEGALSRKMGYITVPSGTTIAFGMTTMPSRMI